MAIANYFVEFTDLQQLWFVVSPQNPLKQKKSLLPDYQRFELVFRAIADDSRFKVSNVEFDMPKPSYTIDTLTYLSEKYPKFNFTLIVGSDSLETFHKWKNYEEILKQYQIYVYPRPAMQTNKLFEHPNVKIVNAPLMEISASFIRDGIKNANDMRHFLSAPVWAYISEMNFYK